MNEVASAWRLQGYCRTGEPVYGHGFPRNSSKSFSDVNAVCILAVTRRSIAIDNFVLIVGQSGICRGYTETEMTLLLPECNLSTSMKLWHQIYIYISLCYVSRIMQEIISNP